MNTEEKETFIEEIQSLREIVANLHARVDFLESQKLHARVDTLEKRLSRVLELCRGSDKLLIKSYDKVSKSITDAFDRIMTLEFKVFPRLADGIAELERVIGRTDDLPECPHETRKP